MTIVIQDLRYAWRMLRKHPGFAAVAVLTLALGIGANTAVFTVINAVLLRSLPYPQSSRLLWMTETASYYSQIPLSFPDYQDWKNESHSFTQMGAVMTGLGSNISTGGEARRVKMDLVTASLFDTLGVRPALGRGIGEDEDRKGAPLVAVLSYGLWQSQFGGERSAIGAKLMVDGAPYTVIGVMPAGFRFYDAPDLWMPVQSSAQPTLLFNRGAHYPLYAVGRLKDGVSLEQGRAEIEGIQRGLEERYPQTTSKYGASVEPLQDALAGPVRPQLLVLSVAMVLILLIACANVANLLLSRSAGRRQEIAVRIALGAASGRLLRQLVTESLLIGLLGGIAGLLTGLAAVRALAPLTAATFSPLQQLTPDARVMGFALLLAVVTGLLFGLAPAWQLTRSGVQESLAAGGRTRSVAMPRRLREALVIAQMTLALVLLAGAGLLMRTFLKLQQVDLGFQPRHLLAFTVPLPLNKYADLGWRQDFFRRGLERLRQLPGVQEAAVADGAPILGPGAHRFGWEGMPAMLPHDAPMSVFDQVSPEYFRVMGIPLVRGREFSEQDTADAPHVSMVNETLAKRIWPGKDPIGQKIKFYRDAAGKTVEWTEVVGVVENVKANGATDRERDEIYIPVAQGYLGDALLDWVFLVRAKGDPAGLAEGVRRTFTNLDREQPIYGVQTMEEAIAASLGTQRMALVLVGIFSGLALAVAAIGVYGVMAYSVSQHTHEIGIRMALGAQPGDVLRMVARESAYMVGIGVAVGLALALAATRGMSALLFQTSPRDPLTFAAVAAGLAAVALLAAWVPARRATQVDPLVALRHE